jgi:outer membrane protein OmpA-like peptidoglycan-associated protein
MKFRGALLAAAVVALPLAAQAQPVTGLYVAGGVGVNLMQQESVNLNAGTGSAQLKSGVGPAGVLSLGWGFGNGFRAEVEGNWMENKFNGTSDFGAASTSGGWEQKYGFMVNGFYDFTTLSPYVVPFVGVGVGYEAALWQSVSAYTTGGSAQVAVHANNNTEGEFAYQAMIGAAIPISGAPGLSLTAEYRFMGLAGTRNYSGTASVSGVGSAPVTVKASDDYNHAILIGLRYAFGAPPPPAPAPVAAPAPAPARSYLVFFDWDKATLTSRAQQIIKEAADNSTKVQYTRIEVNGYTDTSGTPQYNQGLSVRRAQAVAAELVKDGVPKTAIAIQGFGETHLLVPTGAGVREPQNRRVEIIIH